MNDKAIVGFDVAVFDCVGVDVFDHRLFTGKPFRQAAGPVYDFDAMDEQARKLAQTLKLDLSTTSLMVLADAQVPESQHFKQTSQQASILEALTAPVENPPHVQIIAAFSAVGIACIALSADLSLARFGYLKYVAWDDTATMTNIGFIDTPPDSLTQEAVSVLSHSPLVGLGSLTACEEAPQSFNDVLRLIKITLATYQRYLPASLEPTMWPEHLPKHFFTLQESSPWFSEEKRLAALSLGDHQGLLAVEEPEGNERPNGFFALSEVKLCFFSADSIDDLIRQLDQLDVEQPLSALAQSTFEQFDPSKALRLSLIADSQASLINDIQLAKTGVRDALEKKSDWKTPKGSYFTAAPNPEGVCFLYPGIGASYIGLGRSLFRLFPELWPILEAKTYDLGNSLKAKWLHPKTLTPLSFKETKTLEHKLRLNLAEMAECGVAYSCLFTAIFKDVFNVNPDFAAGYSMGEVSMFAALDVWQDPAQMSESLAKSHTFTRRLSGELLALNDAWGDSGDNSWQTLSIRGTNAQVIAASEGLSRVYCTLINTPDNLIIGGHPDDCKTLTERLGVKAMNLNIANAIHSPPARHDYDAMTVLYSLPVNKKIPTEIYSTSCYLPVPQFQNAIKHSIAKCLCEQVDFPRLIEVVQQKGVNVFIEMGPGRSLSSWVDKILHKDAHVSLCVNAKGTKDELTLLRAVAKLASHGVSMDLNSLYTGSINKVLTHD